MLKLTPEKMSTGSKDLARAETVRRDIILEILLYNIVAGSPASSRGARSSHQWGPNQYQAASNTPVTG
jgi:hypothetical protein